MGVSESQRRALHDAARAALGEEEGDTLMALSPPANTDIATRQDVERAEERLGARFDAVDARFEAVDARIEAAAAASAATLTKAMHASELRTMGVIVLAFLGSNLLG